MGLLRRFHCYCWHSLIIAYRLYLASSNSQFQIFCYAHIDNNTSKWKPLRFLKVGETMKALFGLLTFWIIFHASWNWAMPITDTVTVDGREWAQVADFTDLSWSTVNAVCSDGECLAGSILNEYDMTGWVWAASTDVKGLFNGIAGSNLFDTTSNTPEGCSSCSALHPAIFDEGFLPTISVPSSIVITGFIRDRCTTLSGVTECTTARVGGLPPTVSARVGSKYYNHAWSFVGNWFFREAPVAPISAPATLGLLGFGLAYLGLIRRKPTRK